MIKKYSKRLIVALLLAALFAGLAGTLYTLDGMLSDGLYQHAKAADGEIVVVGMDQYSIDVLGPLPWPRSYMAEAIEYLNSDPENRPAAIGIDVLYTGESSDEEADIYLAEAAGEAGNVVVASAAGFGSALEIAGESFGMDTRSVLYWDEPYEELYENSKTGHINALSDRDAVIRHALLYVDSPERGRVYSFARVIYETYCESLGIEPNPMPVTTEGLFYLDYSAAPGGYYDGVSFVSLLNGDVDPEYFADKIVLIGPYAAGLQDEYRTAIDHAAPMYGVEIQANQIEAYRNDFVPKEVPGYVQLAILFVLSALAFLLFYDRKILSAVVIWLSISLGWLAICYLAYRQGFVLHALWAPFFTTALFIASVAMNYIRARLETKHVEDTFGRYVDHAVMKELLESGAANDLGGKLFDIAVLFVDIRGFTTMSESLDPPTVVEIINKYLTLTTECIMKNHGTLDKFVGDCTMAFWNAPLPQEDPCYLACKAAMDMVEGSKALGEELQAKFGRSVSFGVGVNFGPAVVGNIGAPQRMDYTAIGDTVNTAARLEANAPAGTVYISRVVADALGDRAKTTSLGGTIKLKGKAEGFEILTLDELQ